MVPIATSHCCPRLQPHVPSRTFATITANGARQNFRDENQTPLKTLAGAGTSGSNPWQQQKQERRRLLRTAKDKFNAVTGTNVDNNHKLKCAVNAKSIYIKEIDHEMQEKNIEEYVSGNGIRVLQIRQILGKYSIKKSFKVTVPENQFCKVMDGTFWPVGVEVREWLTSEQLRQLSQAAEKNDKKNDDESENDNENE